MKQPSSFTIKVHDVFYTIHPNYETNCILYEVFTTCEKLFTLKKTIEGNWITYEQDVVPISDDLINDIGEELEQHQYQF